MCHKTACKLEQHVITFLRAAVSFTIGQKANETQKIKGDEIHAHQHSHFRKAGEEDFDHHPPRQHRSLLPGMIHGLAGSAALMLLVLSSIQSPVEGVIYILVFGIGSILGMMVISTLIGLPFALSSQRFAAVNHRIRFLAGALSTALGIFLMIDIGFIKGLFY